MFSPSDSGGFLRSGHSPFDGERLSSWELIHETEAARVEGDVALPRISEPSEFPSSIVRANGYYFISFDGMARFRIDFANKVITMFDVADDTTSESLAHLLNDHVAPRILAGAGDFVIHASAVEIDGQLAVFLGETGAGKSTLAASLDRAGHRLIGDDALILVRDETGVTGRSVYPSLRLYPESISAVLGDGVASTPMAQYSTKQRLTLPKQGSLDMACFPIGAVFFLIEDPDEDGVASYTIEPALTCMGLIENGFALDKEDVEAAAQRFEAASQIAECVPGYELSYPWDFDLLPQVRAEIEACLQR